MAKRAKRVKRAYMKVYSATKVNTGSRYNGTLSAEMRTRHKHHEKEEIDGLSKLLKLNPTRGMVEVNKRIREIADNKPMMNHLLVHRGKMRRVFIMYNDKRTNNVIVEVNYVFKYIRYSEGYHNLDRAKQVFRTGTVSWAVSQPMPESAAEDFIPPLPQ